MIRGARLVVAFILGMLGLTAWWHYERTRSTEEVAAAGVRRPDYTVERFTATRMNEEGRPRRRLAALELRHYPNDDSSELERPILTMFQPTTPPWVIRSETGSVSSGAEEVIFHGRVHIDRRAAADLRPVAIVTRELHVWPDTDYAQTDEHVRADSLDDWVTAERGARIWFDEALRLQLAGRVHSLVEADTTDNQQMEQREEQHDATGTISPDDRGGLGAVPGRAMDAATRP